MRPIHEVLELCKPHLYTPNHKDGERFICYAIEDIAGCTVAEKEAASQVVLQAVRKLYKDSAFLRTAAVEAGLLPYYLSTTDENYILFRDEWLNQLIEKEKRNGLPESPTPGSEPQG